MPTILIEGFKFRFYSSDGGEPPHMRVLRGNAVAKVWLGPVRLENSKGYNGSERNRLLRIAEANELLLLGLGMTSSESDAQAAVATGVRFDADRLVITLNDGRDISVDIQHVEWLNWLKNAEAAKRLNWVLEPDGYAMYWPDLDDGVEVCHLLAPSLVA